MVPATSEEYHTLETPLRPRECQFELSAVGRGRLTVVKRIALVAFVFPGHADSSHDSDSGCCQMPFMTDLASLPLT